MRSVWIMALLASVLAGGGSLPGLAATPDPAETPEPFGAEAIDLARFDGLWHRIEIEQDDDVRLSAIDWALEQLSWLLKSMVGRVLRQNTAPPAELHFVWEDGRLYQQRVVEGGEVHRRLVVPDGRMRPDPDGIEIAWQATPTALRLDWIQHQARGSSRYRLAPAPAPERPETYSAGEATGTADASHGLLVEYEIQVTAVENIRPVVYLAHFDRANAPRLASPQDPSRPNGTPVQTRSP